MTPPQPNSVVVLVISMVGTALSDRRLSRLQSSGQINIIVPGYKPSDKIPQWIEDKWKKGSGRYRLSLPMLRSRQACMASHCKALHYAIDNKFDSFIILEDDAIFSGCLKNALPKEMPQDGGCLLGGILAEPKSWARDTRWKKTVAPSLIAGFDHGINKIDYTQFRWHCAVSIFYPSSSFAVKVLQHLKTLPFLTHFDLTLVQTQLIKYLLYPNCFIHDDEGNSQNFMPPKLNKKRIFTNYSIVKISQKRGPK